MKKSKFTEEQIAFALRQAETGTKSSAAFRKMDISEAMFQNLKDILEEWRIEEV